MSSRKVRWIIIIANGLFLLADQFLKWQAAHGWTQPHLFSPYFGWQLFLNRGAAFGLPLSNNLIILLTLPMIGLIGYLLFKELKKEPLSPSLLLAWSMIFAGAISNLLDRVIYSQVVDYFVVGTAIINIGDIMIVVGLGIYIINVKFKNQNAK